MSDLERDHDKVHETEPPLLVQPLTPTQKPGTKIQPDSIRVARPQSEESQLAFNDLIMPEMNERLFTMSDL